MIDRATAVSLAIQLKRDRRVDEMLVDADAILAWSNPAAQITTIGSAPMADHKEVLSDIYKMLDDPPRGMDCETQVDRVHDMAARVLGLKTWR